MLFNEPKLLKSGARFASVRSRCVSVLFNEPKLLKYCAALLSPAGTRGFSALQRAEIAEIASGRGRAERPARCFSALQRAEIAEIERTSGSRAARSRVSVLFNEPKLLKLIQRPSS